MRISPAIKKKKKKAIAPHLTWHEVGARSHNWVWAKVYHRGTANQAQSWIVCSIYVPAQRGQARNSMLRELAQSAAGLMRRFPECPLVMMGDWNMSATELARVLDRWGLALGVQKCRGSNRSRWRGRGEWRGLDHVVVSSNATHLLSNLWVNRSWDISDHWPVECKLLATTEVSGGASVQPHAKPPRMQPK